MHPEKFRRSFGALLAGLALPTANGCYHYVPLQRDQFQRIQVEPARVRATTTSEVVELTDARVEQMVLTGRVLTVRHESGTVVGGADAGRWRCRDERHPDVFGPVLAPRVVPTANDWCTHPVPDLQRLETYQLNRGATAGVVLGTTLGPLVVTGLVVLGLAAGGGSCCGSIGSWGIGGFGGFGRRPAGVVEHDSRVSSSPLGDLFADATELEAASVPAFETLARELALHGAPRRLIQKANAAARDEARHTIMMGRLARRFGGEPRRVDVKATPERTLRDLAIENAVEGCVHETWAALLAHWQADTTSDRAVRATLRRIAVDETRHAELAWAVDAWAQRHLDHDGRSAVVAARRAAVERLAANAATNDPPAELCAVAGLPRSNDAARMVAAARSALWAH